MILAREISPDVVAPGKSFHSYGAHVRRVMERIAALPTFSIAAIDGLALGGDRRVHRATPTDTRNAAAVTAAAGPQV